MHCSGGYSPFVCLKCSIGVALLKGILAAAVELNAVFLLWAVRCCVRSIEPCTNQFGCGTELWSGCVWTLAAAAFVKWVEIRQQELPEEQL